MSKESICHGCGRTVSTQFIFCPWCGSPSDPECFLTNQFDTVFKQIESLQVNWTETRIARMEHDLTEIERSLSEILPDAMPV